jgi:hypothetical protein
VSDEIVARLRASAVERMSGGYGHDAEQISEWAKHTLEWEAADLIERQQARIEELEGIVRELLSYVESDYIGSRGKDYSNGAIGRARAVLEKP